MSSSSARPVLYVIACGGFPSEAIPDQVRRAQGDGWEVCVIGTPKGSEFLDVRLLADLTGYPVRDNYKRPEDPDVLPPADAFLCAPATFNTVNLMAAGASTTLALGILNEAVGGGMPVIVAPWPNRALANHPAFPASVQTLRDVGVRFVLDPDLLPVPNSGRPGSARFPWDQVHKELAGVHARLTD